MLARLEYVAQVVHEDFPIIILFGNGCDILVWAVGSHRICHSLGELLYLEPSLCEQGLLKCCYQLGPALMGIWVKLGPPRRFSCVSRYEKLRP